MKYNNIKNILRKQIERRVKTFWTFDEKDNSFTCIYKNYSDGLTIYTPQQLLNKIMNKDA